MEPTANDLSHADLGLEVAAADRRVESGSHDQHANGYDRSYGPRTAFPSCLVRFRRTAHRFGVARIRELVHFTSSPDDRDELGVTYGERPCCLGTGKCSFVQSSTPHHRPCCGTAEIPMLPRAFINTLYPRIAELELTRAFSRSLSLKIVHYSVRISIPQTYLLSTAS